MANPRNKLTVIDQKLSLNGNTSLILPRNSIHDAYVLRFSITVKNETGADIAAVPVTDILSAIQEIKVVTDAVREHYVLNGLDAAYLTALVHKSYENSVLEIANRAIANNGTSTYNFTLVLDEGDIIAVAHTSVALSIAWNATAGSLTVLSAECQVTVKESIVTEADLHAMYDAAEEGYPELVKVIEPKVCGYTISTPACTEFVGVFDIPTNTLNRGALIHFTGTGGVMPTQVGLLRNTPDRVELGKEDFATRRDLDEMILGTKLPAGLMKYDFGTQWQSNGFGKDGWSFAKHDIELAIKSSVAQTIRYISLESLVSAAYWKQHMNFTQY